MSQQVLFDGFEIQADYTRLNLKADVATALLFGDREPQVGDEFEMTIRFRFGPTINGPEGVENDGNFKGQFSRIRLAKGLHEGMKQTAYVPNAKRDSHWAEEHGAA